MYRTTVVKYFLPKSNKGFVNYFNRHIFNYHLKYKKNTWNQYKNSFELFYFNPSLLLYYYFVNSAILDKTFNCVYFLLKFLSLAHFADEILSGIIHDECSPYLL